MFIQIGPKFLQGGLSTDKYYIRDKLWRVREGYGTYKKVFYDTILSEFYGIITLTIPRISYHLLKFLEDQKVCDVVIMEYGMSIRMYGGKLQPNFLPK